jgi:hypothetical protein
MVANDWEMKAGEERVNKAGGLGMKRYVLPIYNRLARGPVRCAGRGRASGHDGVVPRAEPRWLVDVPGGLLATEHCSPRHRRSDELSLRQLMSGWRCVDPPCNPDQGGHCLADVICDGELFGPRSDRDLHLPLAVNGVGPMQSMPQVQWLHQVHSMDTFGE